MITPFGFNAKTHEIYICCHVEPDGDPLTNFQSSLLNAMRIITRSKLGHIVIAKKNRSGQKLLAYEIIMDGKGVKCHEKSFTFYEKRITVQVTKKQYEILFDYLDTCVKNKVPFNNLAYWWNFLPITRWCPIEGSGVYCSQLIANACAEAKIIDLDTKFKTTGSIECCDGFSCMSFLWIILGFFFIIGFILIHWLIFKKFWFGMGIFGIVLFWAIIICTCLCCCPMWTYLGFSLISCFEIDYDNMVEKLIYPPKTYQMSVKLLWDIIKDQNRKNIKDMYFNPNVYNVDSPIQ